MPGGCRGQKKMSHSLEFKFLMVVRGMQILGIGSKSSGRQSSALDHRALYPPILKFVSRFYLLIVCVSAHMYMPQCPCGDQRTSVRSLFSFHHVGLRDETPVVRLADKHS